MRINTTEDCTPGIIRESNPFCSANIDVTNFLNLNSYVKHDDFCLAYIFTYRDFNGGTLGLAWVAEPGGSGGVCEKHRMMQEGSQNVKKSLNTGIVTLLNYGSYVSCWSCRHLLIFRIVEVFGHCTFRRSVHCIVDYHTQSAHTSTLVP